MLVVVLMGAMMVPSQSIALDSPKGSDEAAVWPFRKRTPRKKEPANFIERLEFSRSNTSSKQKKWRQPTSTISLGPLPSWNAADYPTDTLIGLGGELWPQPAQAAIDLVNPEQNPAQPVLVSHSPPPFASLLIPPLQEQPPLEITRDPNQFLYDPLGLIPKEAADRIEADLQSHSYQCGIPIYIVVLDHEQELSPNPDHWGVSGEKEVFAIYRWAEPTYAEASWGQVQSGELDLAIANSMLISSIQSARKTSDPACQIERFTTELIFKAREIEPATAFRYNLAKRIDPPANLTPVSGKIRPASASLPTMLDGPKASASPVGALGLLGAMAFLSILSYQMVFQSLSKLSYPSPQLKVVGALPRISRPLIALPLKDLGHVLERGIKFGKFARTRLVRLSRSSRIRLRAFGA